MLVVLEQQLIRLVFIFISFHFKAFGNIFLARKNGGIDDQITYVLKTIKPDSDSTAFEHKRICRNELDVSNFCALCCTVCACICAVLNHHFISFHFDLDVQTGVWRSIFPSTKICIQNGTPLSLCDRILTGW